MGERRRIYEMVFRTLRVQIVSTKRYFFLIGRHHDIRYCSGQTQKPKKSRVGTVVLTSEGHTNRSMFDLALTLIGASREVNIVGHK